MPFYIFTEEKEDLATVVYNKVDPAVVSIWHENAGGSGFIIDPSGYIITNGHVVLRDIMGLYGRGELEDPTAYSRRITVILSDERKYQAKVIGFSLDPDVALIKIDPEKPLPIVKLGDSDKVKTGEVCFAYGMPLGLRRTITQGIVSNVERADLGTYTKVFHTDALISPGNSGGPLFNKNAEVIAINTYGVWGHGFSIPINVAKVMKDHFLKYGKFKRANLPYFSIDKVDKTLADIYGIEKGVLVNHVEPNSSAEKAGLKSGDIIISMNGEPVSATNDAELLDFRWKFVTQQIGSEVTLVVKRHEENQIKEYTIKATLEEDAPMPHYGVQVGEMKELRYDELGIGVKDKSIHAKYIHNLPDKEGVWVTRSANLTPSNIAGINVNDIIYEIEKKPVRNKEEFQNELDNLLEQGKKYIFLSIARLNKNIETALAPKYELKEKKVMFVLPEKNPEYFDVIKRFFIENGAKVHLVSKFDKVIIDDKEMKNIILAKDVKVNEYDGIIFFTGEGIKLYLNDEEILKIAREAVKQNKIIAAIGLAPAILINADKSLLKRKITGDSELLDIFLQKEANYTGKEIETDENIITTKGTDIHLIKSCLKIIKERLLVKR
jgi:serine protease Do